MKLRDAMICLDCDEVFCLETVHFMGQKVQMDHCPSCGGKQITRLCRWFQTMKADICKASLIVGAHCNVPEEKEGGVDETTALKGT